MHVLLVSHRFAHANAGGTEVLVHGLAVALCARGLSVTWLAAGDPPPTRDRSGFIPAALPASFSADHHLDWRAQEQAQAARVETLLSSRPPVDIAHVLHFSRIGLAFLDIPRLRDVPVVATLTDYTAICPDHQLLVRNSNSLCTASAPSSSCLACLGLPPEAEGRVADWRSRNLAWLNGRVDAFWAQTPHQASELAQAGVDTAKLVRDRASYPVPGDWASLPRDSGTGDYLLFLGRCSPEKGLHTLLDAFRTWKGSTRLVIVAVPDDMAYEKQTRSIADQDPRVEWRPPLGRGDVGPVLKGARALLVPSQWYENHPIVAHEALALGVPVWCSAVASMTHLAAEPGIHFVDRYTAPESWRDALDSIAGAVPAAPPPSVEKRVTEFETFVDEIVDVYRKQVGA